MQQFLTNSSSWAEPDLDLPRVATRIRIGDSVSVQKACGCVVYGTAEESWVLNNDVHTLIVGKTNSGKSVSCMAPTIASIINCGESAIVYDQKGEFRSMFRSYAQKKGYQVICLNFGSEICEAGWNPFEIAMKLYKEGNRAMSDSMIDDVASAVYARHEETCKDVFWPQTAADYFCGLAKILRKEHGRIDFDLISTVSRIGDEKTGLETNMKKYMKILDGSNLEEQRILQGICGTVQAPNDTRASILSVFSQPFRYLCSDNISRLLYKSSFDMRTIGTRKTIVFLSTPACSSDTDMLVSMFVRQLYTVLVDLVAQKKPNHRLPIRVNMVLDEFSSLPAVKDFSNRMISLARGYNIRFFLGLQSIAQLYSRYSMEDADNILVNCGAIVTFNTKDTRVHELVKKLCGMRQTYYTHQDHPLVSARDIQMLPPGKALMLIDGIDPYITYLPAFYDYHFHWEQDTAPLVAAAAEFTPQTFDFAGFVKRKERKKELKQQERAKSEEAEPSAITQAPGKVKEISKPELRKAGKEQPAASKQTPHEFEEDPLIMPIQMIDPVEVEMATMELDDLIRSIDAQLALAAKQGLISLDEEAEEEGSGTEGGGSERCGGGQ